MLPFSAPRPTTRPEPQLLRDDGWSVQSLTGSYAVAFRGATEVVFVWRGEAWHLLTTRALARPPLSQAA